MGAGLRLSLMSTPTVAPNLRAMSGSFDATATPSDPAHPNPTTLAFCSDPPHTRGGYADMARQSEGMWKCERAVREWRRGRGSEVEVKG